MTEQEIINDLTFYYEVDLDNCTMTHQEWIKVVARALTDKNYLSELMEEIKQYKAERS